MGGRETGDPPMEFREGPSAGSPLLINRMAPFRYPDWIETLRAGIMKYSPEGSFNDDRDWQFFRVEIPQKDRPG